MLIAVPLVITMAVGLVLGLRLVGERDASLRLSSRGGGAASGGGDQPGPTLSFTGGRRSAWYN